MYIRYIYVYIMYIICIQVLMRHHARLCDLDHKGLALFSFSASVKQFLCISVVSQLALTALTWLFWLGPLVGRRGVELNWLQCISEWVGGCWVGWSLGWLVGARTATATPHLVHQLHPSATRASAAVDSHHHAPGRGTHHAIATAPLASSLRSVTAFG